MKWNHVDKYMFGLEYVYIYILGKIHDCIRDRAIFGTMDE